MLLSLISIKKLSHETYPPSVCPACYTQLATSYESLKDFKSAIKYYKAAYESSKSDILLYHLARNYDVYYKDKSQAITYYKRYLSSDDTIRIAREYTRLRLDELSVYRQRQCSFISSTLHYCCICIS